MPFGQLQPTYYRVFQHRRQPGLCCAVRATMLVPYFVRASEWDFGMNLREDGILPLACLIHEGSGSVVASVA